MLGTNPKASLHDQRLEVMRFHHYSLRTEKTYRQWINRFLTFHLQTDHSGAEGGWRQPRDLQASAAAAFLTRLRVAGHDHRRR